MANAKSLKHPLNAYGPKSAIAWVKWTASSSATQTITQSAGVTSVTRTSAGLYVINLSEGGIKSVALLGCTLVPADNNFHETKVTAIDATAKTVSITHRTISYATIVSSGPAVSDTAGEIHVAVLLQRAT